MSHGQRFKARCLLISGLIFAVLTLASCKVSEDSTPTPSIADPNIVTKTVSPSPTSSPFPTLAPPPTPTPNDGLTGLQRSLFHELGIYEDIRNLPTDNDLRASAIGLIDALWPIDGRENLPVQDLTFKRNEIDPNLPTSIINRDQYLVQVEKDIWSKYGSDPSQFPKGTLILWTTLDNDEPLEDTLLIYKPRPGEGLQFKIIRLEDEREYHALIRINEETGTITAYTNPIGDYWIEPIYNSEIVFLPGNEDSPFYRMLAISSGEEDARIFWNETGEPLPEIPDEVQELELYSKENEEGKKIAYLVSTDESVEIEIIYIFGESEDGRVRWIPLLEYFFQQQIDSFRQRLEERGFIVEIRTDEDGTKIVQQGYLEGESIELAYSDVGRIVEMGENDEEIYLGLNIGQIGGVETQFRLERFTTDGDNIVIKTSDDRNYFKYYPDRPLESLRWRQVGEEMAFGLESDNMTFAFGQSIANQGIYNASWSETPYNYTDPETGEVKQLVGVERVEEAWALALKGFSDYLGQDTSLDDLRTGNAIINYTTHDGEEKIIDSSKPVHFTHSLVSPEGEMYRDSQISADAVWFYIDSEGGVSMVYTFVTRDLYNTFNRPSDSYEGLLGNGMSVEFKMIQRGIITTTDFRGFLRNDYNLFNLTGGALVINGGD